MNEKDVIISILQILERQFGVSQELFGEDYEKIRLTSSKVRLTGTDLVYLLFEVEKQYGIKVHRECLDNYGFNTVSGIAKAVLLAKKDNYH